MEPRISLFQAGIGGALRAATLLGPLVLITGCAVAEKAGEVVDVSGFKAELAVVQTDIGKIVKTTNVDRYTFFGAVVVVPLVLSWLFYRMANRHASSEADHAERAAMSHATCEAEKYGYWKQRRARLDDGRREARLGKTYTREPFEIEDDTEPPPIQKESK